MKENEALEQQKSYCKNQAEKCGRIAKYSLDSNNKRAYAKRAEVWQGKAVNTAEKLDEAVAKSAESGIMKAGSDGMAEIIQLGKINTTPLEKEFGKLKTDEIIITNERIDHIKNRHPEDFLLFEKYGVQTVENPDTIIKDCKNKSTVFMVKKLPDNNLNVVARLVVDDDNENLKNSVMTFYRIRNRNLEKLANKNKILYKKE